MSAYNIRVSVSDPDLLMAGDSPFIDADATKIQVYRWTTEALARAGSAGAGTLVTTFTLIAGSEEITEAAGPFTFQYYDDAQVSTSWYRYRFADTALSQFSAFSQPWRPAEPKKTTLRDILFETGVILGEAAERGTASAGSTTTVTCTPVFQSTLLSNDFYKGHWLMVTQDAGGAAAAPEMEEALIASNVASTGVVTLDRTLTAAVGSGDIFITSAYIRPTEMIRCVNRALENMKVLRHVDIGLHSREYLYPAPIGVRVDTDIYEVLGVVEPYGETNHDDEVPIRYTTRSRDGQVWIKVQEDAFSYPYMRVYHELSYRDWEGEMTVMASETSAPLPWLRVAAAAECMEILTRDDSSQGEFANVAVSIERELAKYTARYATRMPARVAKSSGRELVGPGMVS